jgi:predicted ATPase/DNA-binding CsgD family transcriptional regulator
MIHNQAVQKQSPLTGRQRELHQLWDLFEASTLDHTHVVFVSGEPGIGKSRLLQEIAIRAEKVGALVLRGEASEAEGMPPYLPFLQALGSYIRATPPEQLREQAGSIAPVLATILPELSVALGELLGSYPLPADQARLRLFEAIGMFLASLASTAPLVLLLDDLQWADPTSLDLLRHVARQQSTARFLILGAYRAGELASSPALERTLLDLNRARLLTSLSVGPLVEEDMATFAAAYLGLPVDQGVAGLLHLHSEGNPFFAEELLRAWLETGALSATKGLFTLTGELPSVLPSSIVGVVHERLSRLPETTVASLHTAALIGRTFDIAFLAEVLGQDAEAVEESLLAAVRMELIRPGLQDTFTFSHDKVRECLYTEVTSLRRRRLHGFIGRTLEAQNDQESAQHLADLAFHFTQSGDRTRGARYARRAAEQAWQASAFEDALKHSRVALELLSAEESERGTLLLQLGEAAILTGAEREAITAFAEAQNWFQERNDQLAAARAAHGLGRAWGRLEVHASAQAALETALALLEDHPGSQRVRVLVELATLLAVSLGRQREGIAYGEQALDLARRLEDERLEAMANRTVGNLLMRENHLEEAIPLLEQALSLARMADDPVEASECCACLTMAYFWSGQMRRMKEILLRRMELAGRCHEPYQLRHIYTWLVACLGCLGNLVEAEQWLAQAETAISSLASPEPRATLLQVRGIMALLYHDYTAAEEYLTQAVTLFRQMGPGVLIWYLPILGLAQVLLGKRQEALASLEETELLLSEHLPETLLTGNVTAYLAQMALLLEDRERIARYTAMLHPFQGLFLDVLVDRIVGELYTFQGAWSEAQAALSRAEETARQQGLPLELAFTQLAEAQLALTQGGRGVVAQARSLFEQALVQFQELGMSEQALATQARLEQLPERSSSRTARSYPAGLSSREVEVLCLVAKGKSNRQIAEELVLSEKTVANHLARIFARTGTDNRAAAAAFAIRTGIA